ncbi:MAG: hypothetical protein HFE77_05940 [Clostridiales bacterium]|nr:hypothetical protein [Clostridiales bacterium]
MKKNTFILMMAAALLLLAGCSSSAEKQDILAYQRTPMTIEAALSNDNGEARITICITDSENYAVTYAEPSAMKGVSYELQQNEPYLCFGDTRIPITEGEACLGSLALARFFLLDYTMLTSAAPDHFEDKSVTKQLYENKQLRAVVLLDENGLPIQITGETNGFEAVLSDIQITYPS